MMKLTHAAIFLTAFGVYAFDGNAATTISTTLTLTSPSAIISMTGVSATAYFKNEVISNSTIANISGTNVTLSNFRSPYLVAGGVFSTGNGSTCTTSNTLNIATCTRVSQGIMNISFTTPAPNANYWITTGAYQAIAGSVYVLEVRPNISPTTTGFQAQFQVTTGGAVDSTGYMAIWGN